MIRTELLPSVAVYCNRKLGALGERKPYLVVVEQILFAIKFLFFNNLQILVASTVFIGYFFFCSGLIPPLSNRFEELI